MSRIRECPEELIANVVEAVTTKFAQRIQSREPSTPGLENLRVSGPVERELTVV
jgi:hypothetical protein